MLKAALASPVPLRRALLAWYRRHGRSLPWRAKQGEHPDAYRVWVSEIMLQQTRVETVIPYFARFLERFPTVRSLAAASDESVLASWSGLGYYRRARDLRRTAQRVATHHRGKLPLQWDQLRALPGIGDYTAGAILSIADGQRFPAPDANALRIARRVTGAALTPAAARRALAAWVPGRGPGDFNQALMDLGATICVARAPQCGRCPLQQLCATQGEGAAPRASARQSIERIEIQYGFARRDERIWLVQRPATSRLLPGMWELPARSGRGIALGTYRHRITRTEIIARVFAASQARPGAGLWIARDAAMRLPLTGLCRKILADLA